jgi:hypothetical protein
LVIARRSATLTHPKNAEHVHRYIFEARNHEEV